MWYPRDRAFLRSLLFPAVLVIAAQVSPAQITTDEERDPRIRGTVLLESENRPAPGVEVVVKRLPEGPAIHVLTNDEGAFDVIGLSPGDYEVFAEESGHESTRARATPSPGDATTPLRIYLRPRNQAHRDAPGNSVSVRELQIPEKARSAYQKGIRSLSDNDPETSVGYLQKAIAAFPDYYEAYYSLGVAQRRLHLDAEAIDAFQKAIDASGGSCSVAEFAMGVMLAQSHKLAEAEKELRRALEQDANYAKGYLYLSVVLYQMDRLDEAERNALEAERRKPELSMVYLVLANVHSRQGDSREQLRDLAKYVRLNPPDMRPDARKLYEDLHAKLLAGEILSQPADHPQHAGDHPGQ